MTRYIASHRSTKPTAVWADFNQPLIMSATICDHDVADTGLVDQNGDLIMRASNPIGFGRDDEW